MKIKHGKMKQSQMNLIQILQCI